MKKVLVLDDDQDIASMVKMVLDFNGFQGEFITNYNILQETLNSYAPQLLILDISLGGADGRDLCKEIKASANGGTLHVILFSANRDAATDYKQYGADAFIAKPFDSKYLISTVNFILSSAN